jgi:hypothetical protein
VQVVWNESTLSKTSGIHKTVCKISRRRRRRRRRRKKKYSLSLQEIEL